MDFLFLVLTAFIVYTALIISHKFFKIDALFVLGIGCAIGANIFNINSYPVTVGNLIFGIDSIIYTLFIFSTLLAYIYYGKKQAWKLIYSVMFSILLTATLQFVASWATTGYIEDITWNFLSYIASIIATYIAILSIFNLFEFLKNKSLNIYINLSIAIIVASIVNSMLYFGLISAFLGISENFAVQLAGSYIGKGMCIAFSLVSFKLIEITRCGTKKQQDLK